MRDVDVPAGGVGAAQVLALHLLAAVVLLPRAEVQGRQVVTRQQRVPGGVGEDGDGLENKKNMEGRNQRNFYNFFLSFKRKL